VTLPTGPELHVAQLGGSGAPLLLLHAFADSWFSFSELLPFFAGTGLQVVVPDQRGHGSSQVPPSGYAVADFAADAIALLDALDIPAATIVTSSSASFTGRLLARSHPDRVAGLMLLGGPGVRLRGPRALAFRLALAELGEEVPRTFARELLETVTARPMPDAFTSRMLDDNCRVPARVWRSTFDGLLDYDDRDDLQRITAATLVVRGARDEFIDAADVEELVGLIPPARLITYSDVGHVPQWERPDLVAADLLTLVAGDSSAGDRLLPARHSHGRGC
jgi:pimeloyl-ACP methyl ester carboxylesterase